MLNIYEQIYFCIDHMREVPDSFKESTKLLNKWMKKKDPEGIPPEIFIAMSNRTGGKTYYGGYLLMDLFRRFGTKFCIYARTGTELGSTIDGIFSPILAEFEGFTLEEVVSVNNVYSTVYCSYPSVDDDGKEIMNKDICGFVVSLNASDKIKRISSTFYDVDIILMDEFQADRYLPDEVDKFVNIHMSIARGGGKASRCVPVIMLSNSLTIVNPYFTEWQLQSKIQDNTKFYTEPGLCLLRFVNDAVADEQSRSRFNIACRNNKQLKSNISNSWLKDNKACVSKPDNWGQSTYICTFIRNNEKFGMRKYNNGIWYVSRNVDTTCQNNYALQVDGVENVECAKRSLPLQVLRREFERGNVRFSDLACKYTILEWI